MNERLAELERLARQLDPDSSERLLLRQRVMAYAENFLQHLDELPAHVAYDERDDPFVQRPVEESPSEVEEVLEFIGDHVDGVGLNTASAGHLGYIPGGGLYASALGDYLAAVTNRYAGVFTPGPGAVRLENSLIRWMAEIVGYPSDTAGNLTSGGSIANLIAVVTARDARLQPADYERAVVYLSSLRHPCVDKALRISGLAGCQRRLIPLDEYYRARPDELRRQIAEDHSAGLLPWMIVGNAGSTDTGAIDPLNEFADIAAQQDCWFHVDAAYGGYFVLLEEGRGKLRGMERSDSLVMDPHKGLFLPFGLGTVLVKDPQALAASHHYQAACIQNDTSMLSPADLSPELTKHFRGMRLWLPLQIHGLAPFRACLQEKLLLGRYFWQQIQAVADFEVGPEPDLSVVIYRLRVAGDAEHRNAVNVSLAEAVVADGRVYISYTTLSGEVWLRFAALSFRTHKATVDVLLEVLATESRRLL